ncbi:MAG: helix-turn-helix domain-containing protein [Phycisphaerae bacterium]|nr:helix-turn-helix domain-containing protein [Phycisphaerae bacterium]
MADLLENSVTAPGLLHTSMSIQEVANKCGFRRQDYFCTWFRQQTRTTPTAFRSSIQIRSFK